MKTLAARFWSKVDKRGPDECWEWTASRFRKGYGQINGGRKIGVLRAHRVSWELHHGKIEDGKQVLHSCDNPPCVNPGHLWVGTNLDNATDRYSKGRSRGGSNPGESNPYAKLRQSDADYIRNSDIPTKELALYFGVCYDAVYKIRAGINWSCAR